MTRSTASASCCLQPATNLDSRGWWRLAAGLRTGDPDHELLAAWQLKEITRDVYLTGDEQTARETLELLYAWAQTTTTPECRRFAGTVHRWQKQFWLGIAPVPPPTGPPKPSSF